MSRPEDIPADVWEAAVEVTKAMPTAFGWRKITEGVARAILAERERCAKVADTYVGGEHEAQGRAAGEIAADIRAGTP